MSKVLVTGAQGFLGVRLVSFLAKKYEVVACSHFDLDITNREVVVDTLTKVRPDFVVHCAAISDTGFSQEHPDLSLAVNVQGTENIALACASIDAKMVYMSSDQVYNGTPLLGGLAEDVELCPTSVYGKHKLEAEYRVQEINPEAVALRLTWMYDLPDSPLKLNRNILVNLQQAVLQGKTISAAVHEYRGITSVWDVVKRIECCFDLPGGTYNFGCENTKNSYETFTAIAGIMQLPKVGEWLLLDENRFVEQPRNLSMNLKRLHAYGVDFPDTLEGVRLSWNGRYKI